MIDMANAGLFAGVSWSGGFEQEWVVELYLGRICQDVARSCILTVFILPEVELK